MKTVLVIVCLSMLLCCAHSQHKVTSIDLQYINKPKGSVRIGFVLIGLYSETSRFYINLGYPMVALAIDRNTQRAKISANGLGILIPGAIFELTNSSMPWALVAIPFALTNLGIGLEIIPQSLFLNVFQRTDFYLFYKPSIVYSEVSLGLRYQLSDFGIQPNVSFPINRAFFADKSPYFGVDIGYKITWHD